MMASRSLLKAVSVGDFEAVKILARSSRKLNSKDSKGNSPLHIAVTQNNYEIVAFLLKQKKIIVNVRNFFGESPLFLAVQSGCLEIAKLLIRSDGNIHIPNSKDVTPLHMSVPFPSITKLLLEKGAQVEARDINGETALHYAIVINNLESICALLTYNADANAFSKTHQTPFFKAVRDRHEDIIEVLLDYVADFSDYSDSFLSLVILMERCDFVHSIIEKGAKVNSECLNTSLGIGNPDMFKMILNRIPAYKIEGNGFFSKFLDLVPNYKIAKYLEILIESPKMKLLVKSVSHNNLNLIDIFSDIISEELMTKFLFSLLMYGYQLLQADVYAIFFSYGYSELLRTLLHINYEGSFICTTLTPRLIFKVTSTVEQITKDCLYFQKDWLQFAKCKKDIESFFEYCFVPQLIALYMSHKKGKNLLLMSSLPKVPSLVELARNKTREHIVAKKGFTRAYQYYTYIKNIPISPVYKKILMFQTKLYGIAQHRLRFPDYEL